MLSLSLPSYVSQLKTHSARLRYILIACSLVRSTPPLPASLNSSQCRLPVSISKLFALRNVLFLLLYSWFILELAEKVAGSHQFSILHPLSTPNQIQIRTRPIFHWPSFTFCILTTNSNFRISDLKTGKFVVVSKLGPLIL